MNSPAPLSGRRLARRLQAVAHALETGDVTLAEQYLAVLAQTHARHPEYLRLQAMAHDTRGRTREAMVLMQQALALRPDDAVFHNTMGTVFSHAGEFDAAINVLQRATTLDPGLAVAWYNLGVVLAHAVRYAEAIAALQRAGELNPRHPAIRAQLADVLRDHGDVDAAAKAYRGILREQPWAGVAWRGLADLKNVAFVPDDIQVMRAALASPQARDDDRIAIGHALARALEDAGDYAGALQMLAQAKQRARQRQTWDAQGFSRNVTSILDAFAAPAAGAVAHELGREVIFIVGLPRSGTTLVEQILASHHAVEGTGELADLKGVLIAESRRRNAPFPEWVAAMQPNDWERLGRDYLERTAHWRTRRAIFTDKLPSNWMFVGAIMAMLPAARVVCCRRDPLETCFSCYRQFRTSLDYAGTFADLAAFWRDYDRSVRAWCERYAGRVFQHEHERLLAEPEAAIRQLLAGCGLEWDANCLAFQNTPRDIHTPSATQVREPLRRDTARAPRYGPLLDPLRAALQLPPAGGDVFTRPKG